VTPDTTPPGEDGEPFREAITDAPERIDAARAALRSGALAPAVALRPLRDPAEALRRLRTPLFAGTGR
jgi:hypothetical protein